MTGNDCMCRAKEKQCGIDFVLYVYALTINECHGKRIHDMYNCHICQLYTPYVMAMHTVLTISGSRRRYQSQPTLKLINILIIPVVHCMQPQPRLAC